MLRATAPPAALALLAVAALLLAGCGAPGSQPSTSSTTRLAPTSQSSPFVPSAPWVPLPRPGTVAWSVPAPNETTVAGANAGLVLLAGRAGNVEARNVADGSLRWSAAGLSGEWVVTSTSVFLRGLGATNASALDARTGKVLGTVPCDLFRDSRASFAVVGPVRRVCDDAGLPLFNITAGAGAVRSVFRGPAGTVVQAGLRFYNITTGRLLWEAPTGLTDYAPFVGPAGYAASAVVVLRDDARQANKPLNRDFAVLDLETGQRLSSLSVLDTAGHATNPWLTSDCQGLVVAAWFDEPLGQARMQAYSVATGQPAWSRNLGAILVSGLQSDASSMLVTSTSGMQGLSCADGHMLWTAPAFECPHDAYRCDPRGSVDTCGGALVSYYPRSYAFEEYAITALVLTYRHGLKGEVDILVDRAWTCSGTDAYAVERDATPEHREWVVRTSLAGVADA